MAWGKSNWNKTVNQPFSFWNEGQITAYPVRSAQYVQVRLRGLLQEVPKNRLYKMNPVIAIENMHEDFDYCGPNWGDVERCKL